MLTKSDIDKLKKEFTTKDDFYPVMDKVMGELQAIREEITVFAYRQSNHSDRIENLEQKIFNKSFA